MKCTLALLLPILVLLALGHHADADHSNSKEAKKRKDDADGLCQKKAHSSHQKSANSEEPTAASPTGTPPPTFPCTYTDALLNATDLCSEADGNLIEDFVYYQLDIILNDVTLTDEEKVVKCSYATKHFFDAHDSIKQALIYTQISTWGLFFDFEYVAHDLQADLIENIVTLDANDDCILFDALLNATANTIYYSATIQLVEEMKVVLLDVTLTFAQKMAKVHELIVSFFEANVSWESFFLSIDIEGFGSFESCIDVVKGYDQAMTLSEVIGGSSDSDCELLKELTVATQNTSFSISVRNQLKNYHDVLQAYFQTTTDIQLRITYITSQYYQMEIVEPWIVQSLFMVSLNVNGQSWGIFYDLLWCSQFCYNSGSCGNLDNGLGTTVPPSTTMQPANCASRASLIVVTSQNTTILTDVLTTNYNSWNSSVKLGFNSCFNKIRRDIWNNTAYPTPASKITQIVIDFQAYNPNNKNAASVLTTIFIQAWQGTIQQFMDCGSG